jgi:hypothetical protein
MKRSVEIDTQALLFAVEAPPLRAPHTAAGFRLHRSIIFTRFYHALAKKLREEGVPEIKLSVFEVDDAAFRAAVSDAGIGWQTESNKPDFITFFWNDQSERVDAIG